MPIAKSSRTVAALLLLFLAFCAELLQFIPFVRDCVANGTSDILLAIHFIALITGAMGLVMLHIFNLNEDGICHKWLGITYRRTPWTTVKSISRAYFYKGTTVLFVSCDNKHNFSLRQHRSWRNELIFTYLWITGKYFVLIDKQDVMKCVNIYHGGLNADCLQ